MNLIDRIYEAEIEQSKCTCVDLEFPCPRYHEDTPDCICEDASALCPRHDT